VAAPSLIRLRQQFPRLATGERSLPAVALTLTFATALAAAAFFVLRPAGYWSENDTVVLSDAITWMVRSQQLIPNPGFVYPHGYAYQAVATFLLAATGLPVSTFQQLLSPLLFPLLVAPLAVATYRELCGGLRAGVLAAVLLLLEPEFLFVTLRSSHEKVSRSLMLLSLWLLARTLSAQGRRGYLVSVGLFAAAVYGVISSNVLFATSFVVGLASVLPAGWLLSRLWDRPTRHQADRLVVRLILPCACAVGLLWLFNAVIYPPARSDSSVYQEIFDKVTHLVHSATQEGAEGSPYVIVQASWISRWAYLLVSLGNWLLIGGSFVYWLLDGWQWVVRRRGPSSQVTWFLWILYSVFAAQVVAAVVVDFSGALAQNLQYRAFQSFTLVAVAVLARGLVLTIMHRPIWVRLPAAAFVAGLAVLGAVKAANEPLLSNKWTFYTPQEMQALRWADTNDRNAGIWTEADERLMTGYQLGVTMDLPPTEREVNGNQLDDYLPVPGDRDYVVSDVTRARAQRLGFVLLPSIVQLRTYDNGSAQIYRQIRLTPYEP
jgi:hypothetical protein